jgi:hypothetical protein
VIEPPLAKVVISVMVPLRLNAPPVISIEPLLTYQTPGQPSLPGIEITQTTVKLNIPPIPPLFTPA